MRSMRKTSVAVGLSAMVAGTVVAAPQAVADPAPERPVLSAKKVPVWHVPPTGIVVSGLVVPMPWFAVVYASSFKRGEVTFSVPTSREICATTAASARVDINYVNLTTGKAGAVTVTPCPGSFEPLDSRYATAHPGSGPVALAVGIRGTRASIPAIPGGGGFVAS